MAEPRNVVQRLESAGRLPDGDDERFSGYGVMAVPFSTGHLLAMRHFHASSIGPGYTSIWHWSPEGRWTFYTSIDPARLGDFWLPNSGLFAIGRAFYEPFDPQRRRAAVRGDDHRVPGSSHRA